MGEFTNDLDRPAPAAMSHSADALYKMSEVELLAAYAEARRQFVEKKFARDTRRARLAWPDLVAELVSDETARQTLLTSAGMKRPVTEQ